MSGQWQGNDPSQAGQPWTGYPRPPRSRAPLFAVLAAIAGVLVVAALVAGLFVYFVSRSSGPVILDLTYQLDPSVSVQSPGQALDTTRDVMQARLDSIGAKGSVSISGDQVRVQIRSIPDGIGSDDIRSLLSAPGQLLFVLLPPDEYGTASSSLCPSQPSAVCKPLPAAGETVDPSLPAQFTGAQLDALEIRAEVDPSYPDHWTVAFGFNSTTAAPFAEWTGRHVGDYFAIVMDGKALSVPYVASEITGGKGQISGAFSRADATILAAELRYGALPYPVEETGSSGSSS